MPGDQGAQSEIYKTEKLLLKFVRARGVEWLMGAATNEAGFIGWNVEKNSQVVGNQGGEPLRRVRLSQNYYLGVYEVTQDQYRRVTGQNPAAFADAEDSQRRSGSSRAARARAVRSPATAQSPARRDAGDRIAFRHPRRLGGRARREGVLRRPRRRTAGRGIRRRPLLERHLGDLGAALMTQGVPFFLTGDYDSLVLVLQ